MWVCGWFGFGIANMGGAGMSNEMDLRIYRVAVDDLENLGVPVDGEADEVAGELLPEDFPREGFSEEQLVLLEEYWVGKRCEVLAKFFELLRVHPRGAKLTLGHVVLNVAILSKMLGLGDDEFGGKKVTWEVVCASLGLGHNSLYRHKARILELIREMRK